LITPVLIWSQDKCRNTSSLVYSGYPDKERYLLRLELLATSGQTSRHMLLIRGLARRGLRGGDPE
jgi:hypothetical protein